MGFNYVVILFYVIMIAIILIRSESIAAYDVFFKQTGVAFCICDEKLFKLLKIPFINIP